MQMYKGEIYENITLITTMNTEMRDIFKGKLKAGKLK